MFSAILGLLGNAVMGSVAGFVGNIITSIVNFKYQKIKNEHEVAMRKLDMEYLNLATETSIRVAAAQGQNVVDAINASAFEKSIVAGTQKDFSDRWLDKMLGMTGWIRIITIPLGLSLAVAFAFLDFVKALMRPGLTLYLVGASTLITVISYDILEKAGISAIDSTGALAIFTSAVDSITFLTVSCVTWWFADRTNTKFLSKLQDGNLKPGVSSVPAEEGGIMTYDPNKGKIPSTAAKAK